MSAVNASPFKLSLMHGVRHGLKLGGAMEIRLSVIFKVTLIFINIKLRVIRCLFNYDSIIIYCIINYLKFGKILEI